MITLRDFGSFHVGGRKIVVEGMPERSIPVTKDVTLTSDPNGDYWIEQAYVQYFLPAELRLQLPLLLLHGGGLAGTCFETTPDGRPGWLQHFVGAGIATYVIDSVERGRAGFCALPDHWPEPPIARTTQEAWSLFRIGTAEGYGTRLPFPGQRFPVEAFDRFVAQFVPRWTSLRAAHLFAAEAAIEAVGPCFLLAHSQGGDAAFDAALRRPDLVRGVIAVEPSGFPEAGLVATANQRFLFLLGDFLEHHPMGGELFSKGRACHEAILAAGASSVADSLARAGHQGQFPHDDDGQEQRPDRRSDR